MPQSIGCLPSTIARRSAIIFSTRGCSLKFAGHRRRLDAELLQARHRHAGVGGVGPVPVLVRRPVDDERRLVVRQHRRVRVIALVHRRAIRRDHRVGVLGGDHAFGDQPVGVELARARMLVDLLVHQRLRDHRLVGLVVAEPAEADEVDEHVLVEALPVVERELGGEQARLGIVAVDVEDRRLDHLRDVGAVERAAHVARIGRREADLVVDDDVDRAAGVVAARLRHVQAFLHDALPGDRGVAVDQHRQHLVAARVAGAGAGARARCPRRPD